MKNQDARKLSPETQEELRRRVILAIRKGMTQTEAAQTFGISESIRRTAPGQWWM